ncbi:MAG: hypothetical protein HOW97_29525 [Catenulispora sp.]|nr:hypothetical protein [Catenulispora sp.]
MRRGREWIATLSASIDGESRHERRVRAWGVGAGPRRRRRAHAAYGMGHGLPRDGELSAFGRRPWPEPAAHPACSSEF